MEDSCRPLGKTVLRTALFRALLLLSPARRSHFGGAPHLKWRQAELTRPTSLGKHSNQPDTPTARPLYHAQLPSHNRFPSQHSTPLLATDFCANSDKVTGETGSQRQQFPCRFRSGRARGGCRHRRRTCAGRRCSRRIDAASTATRRESIPTATVAATSRHAPPGNDSSKLSGYCVSAFGGAGGRLFSERSQTPS